MLSKRPKLLYFKFIFVALTFFAFNHWVNATIVINEIMYDPQGTDASSGGEWIEVKNVGSSPIDLSDWVFFENKTNHKITALGSSEIPVGGFAVIIPKNNSNVFLNYFTDFSGQLFEASFSLNNGEILSMKNDADAEEVGVVEYTSEWGAKNDGNSLNLVNGVWISASPTPGQTNNSTTSSEDVSTSGENEDYSSQSGTSQVGTSSEEQKFDPDKISTKISANKKIITAGEAVEFLGEMGGLPSRFLWTFGDGSYEENNFFSSKTKVIHSYDYPGDYVVSFEAYRGDLMASSRMSITVLPLPFTISAVGFGNDGFVEIKNNSNYDLNLSYWLLRSGNQTFVIPKNTFIMAKKKLTFSGKVSGLVVGNHTTLLYPNGKIATEYGSGGPKLSFIDTSVSGARKDDSLLMEEDISQSDASNVSLSESEPAVRNDEVFPEEKSVAGLANSNMQSPKIFMWLSALLAIIILAIFGVVLFGSKREVEEIRIIE